MNKLSKLASIAGLILSGQVIDFRFMDELPLDNVRGLAFRNSDHAVVMIDDCLGDKQTFKTIIHEIAHVKLDYEVLADVKIAPSLSGRYLSEVRTLPKKRHNRTYDLSRKWIDQADRLAPGGDCAEKLAALGKYYLEK